MNNSIDEKEKVSVKPTKQKKRSGYEQQCLFDVDGLYTRPTEMEIIKRMRDEIYDEL